MIVERMKVQGARGIVIHMNSWGEMDDIAGLIGQSVRQEIWDQALARRPKH